VDRHQRNLVRGNTNKKVQKEVQRDGYSFVSCLTKLTRQAWDNYAKEKKKRGKHVRRSNNRTVASQMMCLENVGANTRERPILKGAGEEDMKKRGSVQ